MDDSDDCVFVAKNGPPDVYRKQGIEAEGYLAEIAESIGDRISLSHAPK